MVKVRLGAGAAADLLLCGMVMAAGWMGCSRSSRPTESDDSTRVRAGMPAKGRSSSQGAAGSSALLAYIPHPTATLRAVIAKIRIEDYASAAELFERLSPLESELPQVRYLKALTAKQLGKYTQALELCVGLEGKLGVLETQLPRLRAECELMAGPFDGASSYFQASKQPKDGLLAAEAEERAGRTESALKLVQKVLTALPGGAKELEFRGRLTRARLAEKLKLPLIAATDLRWLAIEFPTRSETSDADTRLKAVWKYPLTSKERLGRAQAFSQAGDFERCERELLLVDKTLVKAGERQSILGRAYYASRKDYLRASELLTLAAKNGSREPVMDLFHAARALSRGDADDQALRKYDELARRYPGTIWAEHARYQRARLLFVLGRWKEAKSAYIDYKQRYPKKARHRDDADRELAVLWLILGDSKRAEPAFAALELKAKRKGSTQQLRALAFELGGNKPRAIQLYREIVQAEPLSFAALLSRLRLQGLGEVVQALASSERPRVEVALRPKLPEKVLALAELGLERDAEQALLGLEGEISEPYPTRKVEALCGAYATLATAERRFQLGSRNAKLGLFDALPTPQAWWMFDCAYPRPYTEHVREVSTAQVPASLLFALMRQESGFRVQVTSGAHARGLMQIIQPTAQRIGQELGVEVSPNALDRPFTNVRFGAYYLDALVSVFQGSVPLALAGYNAGPTAVGRWLRSGKELPLDLFVATIPYEETREYVERVMTNWVRYAYLAGEPDLLARVTLKLPQGVNIDAKAY